MKKAIFSLFFTGCLFSVGFADTLILNKNGYSTYIQEIEYPLSQGINDIGPINLKPFANTEGIRIEGKGISLVSYIVKNRGSSWREKLLGKFVVIKGKGRTIKGKVVGIGEKFIEISTKKGFTLTTLPEYPSALNTPLTWSEIYSPQIDVRIRSKSVQTTKLRIIYPAKNITWKPEYVLKNDILDIYITLINNSPVSLHGVNIRISGFYRPVYLKNKTLERFSVKKIKVYSGKLSKIVKKLHGSEVMAVYQGDQFIGYRKLNELFK